MYNEGTNPTSGKDYRGFSRALAGMMSARKVIRLITGIIGSQLMKAITKSLTAPPYTHQQQPEVKEFFGGLGVWAVFT